MVKIRHGGDHPFTVMDAEGDASTTLGMTVVPSEVGTSLPEQRTQFPGCPLFLFSRQGAKYAKKIRHGGKANHQKTLTLLCASAPLREVLFSSLRLCAFARKRNLA